MIVSTEKDFQGGKVVRVICLPKGQLSAIPDIVGAISVRLKESGFVDIQVFARNSGGDTNWELRLLLKERGVTRITVDKEKDCIYVTFGEGKGRVMSDVLNAGFQMPDAAATQEVLPLAYDDDDSTDDEQGDFAADTQILDMPTQVPDESLAATQEVNVNTESLAAFMGSAAPAPAEVAPAAPAEVAPAEDEIEETPLDYDVSTDASADDPAEDDPEDEVLAASSKGPDAAPSKGPDAASSKGPDAASSKGPDATTSKGPDATTSKGPDDASSKGPDAATSKGPDAATSKGPDAASSKGPDAATSKGPDAASSKGPCLGLDQRVETFVESLWKGNNGIDVTAAIKAINEFFQVDYTKKGYVKVMLNHFNSSGYAASSSEVPTEVLIVGTASENQVVSEAVPVPVPGANGKGNKSKGGKRKREEEVSEDEAKKRKVERAAKKEAKESEGIRIARTWPDLNYEGDERGRRPPRYPKNSYSDESMRIMFRQGLLTQTKTNCLGF